MAARILIITNGHLCRQPRPLKEAETLGRAGHDVTVLTVRNHRASEVLDRELVREAPFRRVAIDMLPEAGTGGTTVFRRRLQVWIARRASARLGAPTIRALGPAAAMLRQARRLPADLTIVHTELPFWVGTHLLQEGRRVAADFEDWHSEDLLPEDRARRPLPLLREIEQTLLHRAVYTTTTSHALADALHRRHGGDRPQVITNSFPLQPVPQHPGSGGPPTLFWFSQTLGPGRGLETFFDVWTRLDRPSRVVLLGEPCAGYESGLLGRLPPNLRAAVTVRPVVPPALLSGLIAAHDAGLALERAEIPSRDLTITNKILQYLNAGLAVVASDTAGQREVLVRGPDAGVIVDFRDPAPAAAVLDAFLSDRAALARRQAAARRLAEEVYCWEREAPVLLSAVAAALTQTRSS